MNGPDWLAEHSTGPIDPALAVLLVETWMRSDPDGQRRVWQLAHPHLYREDPLSIHDHTSR